MRTQSTSSSGSSKSARTIGKRGRSATAKSSSAHKRAGAKATPVKSVLSRATSSRGSKRGKSSGWFKLMTTAAALGLSGAAYAYYRHRGEIAKGLEVPTEDFSSTQAEEHQTDLSHEADAEYMTS